MSHAIQHGNVRVVVIEETADAECELCGKVDELRPYGPNGENICFSCGMKDLEMTTRRCEQVLFGKGFDA